MDILFRRQSSDSKSAPAVRSARSLPLTTTSVKRAGRAGRPRACHTKGPVPMCICFRHVARRQQHRPGPLRSFSVYRGSTVSKDPAQLGRVRNRDRGSRAVRWPSKGEEYRSRAARRKLENREKDKARGFSRRSWTCPQHGRPACHPLAASRSSPGRRATVAQGHACLGAPARQCGSEGGGGGREGEERRRSKEQGGREAGPRRRQGTRANRSGQTKWAKYTRPWPAIKSQPDDAPTTASISGETGRACADAAAERATKSLIFRPFLQLFPANLQLTSSSASFRLHFGFV